jgi:4-amino-4-deoxy-L-arabinose transferase-like glycosyltransferase
LASAAVEATEDGRQTTDEGRRTKTVPHSSFVLRLSSVEFALPFLLLAFAAAVRWPNLWLIPAFTDETIEARLAIAIFRGEAFPLTNVEPYIGAFWNYLVAAGFGLFGLNPWVPRGLSFTAGVATVAAAWWLGRDVGGRFGGLVAAGFLAANSTHILVNSHVGWSHATTPLFSTLGFVCLWRAAREAGSGRWLIGAGLFLGLAVQTHLTAALLLPGAGLAVAIKRPSLLRTRWTVLALAAFIIATANLVAYNLATGGQSLVGGQEVVADYTREDGGVDPDSYVENFGRLTLASSWILSGAIEKRRFVRESLADPILVLYLGAAIGSVLWAARRGYILPLLVALPYALVLPLVNPKYEPLLNGRYLVPLLPLVFASVGMAATDLSGTFFRRWPARAPILAGGLGLGLAVMALYPLLPLARYETSTDRTNHAVIAAYETVAANRAQDETVLLDYGLDGIFYMAAGSAYKSMELLLSANDVPYDVIDARASSLEDALGTSPRLLVLNADKVSRLGREFELTPLDDGGRGPGFGVYRIARRSVPRARAAASGVSARGTDRLVV